jgi:hypothetical protein
MPDVSGLVPEARSIVQQVAGVYMRHTAPWFIGLIAHGSAVKGGVIPNCSDIDFQLYLRDPAFSWQGQLPLELGCAIRRDLEGINLVPFRYVQCYLRRPEPDPNLVGPIPGAYHLVAGELPVSEATAQDLHRSARRALDELDTAPRFIMGKLLGPGGVRLERSIRLLCTKVWPVLYQVLTLYDQESDPIRLWCLSKERAIRSLPHDTPLHDTIQAFHRTVWAYYPDEASLENALSVFQTGVAFLQAAADWWQVARLSQADRPLSHHELQHEDPRCLTRGTEPER